MTYADLTALIANYAVEGQPSAEFTAVLPSFIANAEQRIYRELTPSAASGQNTSLATAIGNRVVPLTVMSGQTVSGDPVAFQYPVIVEDVAANVAGAWVPFAPAALAYLDLVWPSATITAPPSFGLAYFTLLDDQTLVLAPTPDAVYPLRITGVWRPAPLSASNPNIWLSQTFPDLLFIAAMVEATGWMRDFGQQSDNPQMALSWNQRYDQAMKSAMQEEALRQGQGPGWQAQAPAPLAGSART